VAACDVPALREVLDGRAQLAAIDDLDGLIAIAEAAHRPAPPPLAWTWDDAAAATWDVYEQAARAPAATPASRRHHEARRRSGDTASRG
jgi:hypothetical protein